MRAAFSMMGFLSAVLFVDRANGGGGLFTQRLLGVSAWAVLLFALSRKSPLLRAQTAIVVAFATLIEYVFSPTLHVYIYRFDNVPSYVPPGHGLVYLSAFALGHSPQVLRHLGKSALLVLLVGGVWSTYGWFFAPRPDGLGFFWFACLAAMIVFGPSRPVYVGAFVVVTWLELLGTHLRNWEWQIADPIAGCTIGNPPSGSPGGYGWFDLAALLGAPHLLRFVSRLRNAHQFGGGVAYLRGKGSALFRLSSSSSE